MQNKYKRFIWCLILLTVIFSFLLALFNYLLDPAGLFRNNEYELGMAKILAKGKNVANVYNYDERLFIKYLIENIKFKPNTVVMGSSRVMQVEPPDNGSFLNTGVSGASIEDLIAIYGIYKKNNINPKIVIIGLDSWILNKNNEQTRWQALKKDYFDEVSTYNIKNIPHSNELLEFKKIKELFSFAYFKASLDKLINNKSNSTYYETDLLLTDSPVRRKNGTIGYAPDYRDSDVAKVKDIVKKSLDTNKIYSINNFTELSNKELFEKFINNLLNKNVKIIFFLPPYHPLAYARISTDEKYKNVLNAEKYFYDFAKKKHIEIFGSFNPKNLYTEKDFYDEMHLKEEIIKKINFVKY